MRLGSVVQQLQGAQQNLATVVFALQHDIHCENMLRMLAAQGHLNMFKSRAHRGDQGSLGADCIRDVSDASWCC